MPFRKKIVQLNFNMQFQVFKISEKSLTYILNFHVKSFARPTYRNRPCVCISVNQR